ncbi:hypothetical protein HDZ31DRAFT_28350 [Schizophyllum fasciatum]
MSSANCTADLRKTVHFSHEELFQRFAKGWERLPIKSASTLVTMLRHEGLLLRPAALRPTSSFGLGRLLNDLVSALQRVAQCAFPWRFLPNGHTTSYETVPQDVAPDDEGAGAAANIHAFHTILRHDADASRPEIYCKDVTRSCLNDVGAVYVWAHDVDEAHRASIAIADRVLFNDMQRTHLFTVSVSGPKLDQVSVCCHSRLFTAATEVFDLHENPAELVQTMLFAMYASPKQLGIDDTIHKDVNLRQVQEPRLASKVVARLSSRDASSKEWVRVVDAYVPSQGKGQMSSAAQPNCVLRDYALYDGNLDALDPDARMQLIVERLSKAAGVKENDKPSAGALKRSLTPVLPFRFTLYYRYFRTLVGPRLNRIERFVQPDTSLRAVDDPAMFFRALGECVEGLNDIRRAGNIHQSVCLENIRLQLDDSGHLRGSDTSDSAAQYKVKLAGLESSKRYLDVNAIKPPLILPALALQGDPKFVPTELVLLKHNFVWRSAEGTPLAEAFFAYNPFHDLESILWIALDFALHHVPRSPPAAYGNWRSYEGRLRSIGIQVMELFPELVPLAVSRQPNYTDRVELLSGYMTGFNLKRLTDALEGAYGKASPFLSIVLLFKELVAAFVRAEAAPDHVLMCFEFFEDVELPASTRLHPSIFEQNATIYDRMREGFVKISAHFADGREPLVQVKDVDWRTGAPLHFRPDPPPPEASAQGNAMDGDRAAVSSDANTSGSTAQSAPQGEEATQSGANGADCHSMSENSAQATGPPTGELAHSAATASGKRKAADEPETEELHDAKRQREGQ